MYEAYELLLEKEKIWAEMYIKLLEENDIICKAIPVNGVGLSMKIGSQDILRIYVPTSAKAKAEKILNEVLKDDQS